MLNEKILSKIFGFSWQQQIQNIKVFKHYTEKDKIKIWTELSSLGQESTIHSQQKHNGILH